MKTHAEDATDRIRAMILGGQLAPGTHLQENPLAASLGYSRTPIRTALNSLALQGLLHYRPNGGYQVRRFTVEEMVEAYEVRATLEGMACRVAVERGISNATAERLRTYVSAMEKLFERGEESLDRQQWRSMNHGLHAAFLTAAGNRTLSDMVEQAQLGPMASAHVIATLDETKNFALIHQAHIDHVHIVDAVLRGHATRAESRMREHLHVAGQFLREDFERVFAKDHGAGHDAKQEAAGAQR
ncbi:MAG: GntR family transcriptional regulator [Alphaproteobacteria bacterium]